VTENQGAWVPTQLLKDHRLSAQDKIVWVAMNKFADDQHQCLASASEIAEKTGLSRRTIVRSVAALRKQKWLELCHQTSLKTNLYLVLGYDVCQPVTHDAPQDVSMKVEDTMCANLSQECAKLAQVPSAIYQESLFLEQESTSTGTTDSTKDIKSKREKRKREKIADPEVEQVLAYLNEKVHNHYRAPGLIPARLKTYSLEECKTVIDQKCEEWLGTEFERNLNPTTLFRPSHFDVYLHQPSKKFYWNEKNSKHVPASFPASMYGTGSAREREEAERVRKLDEEFPDIG
jgi:uncharacterized phage protein (TIGR02220 family)